MVYQIPPAKKSKDQDRFEFKLPGNDEVFSLPKFKQLKPALVASVETGSVAAIRSLYETYAPGVFDDLENSEQLEALTDAWLEDSGVTLGESEASATS